MPQHGRVLNWHPHRKSSLDLWHTPRLLGGALTIADLQAACPPVRDQGRRGKCTAMAVTGAFETKERLNGRGAEDGEPSSNANYFWARRKAGNQNSDTGSTVTDATWAALTYGLPLATLWDDDKPLDLEPTAGVYADGMLRRPGGKSVARVKNDVAHLWAMLAACDPVPCGFPVLTSFMGNAMARTGIWPGPQKGDQVEGGHAVCMIGYDPQMRRFKFRNSWGPAWGIHGYFWMPEAFVLSDFDDFITVADAPHLQPAAIPA